MSRPAPKSRRRKALNTSEEEFFERVLFLWGPPNFNHRRFENRYSLGYREWLKKTDEGQRFVALVESHGEGRTRAVSLYIRYSRWYHNQRGLR